MERTLVTAALPYANGPLHIGHIAGAYLPADVYVRHCRAQKRDVVFICGTDEHGVPITLAAEKRNITPKAFVDEVHNQMETTFARLGISFDNFSGTARPNHYAITSDFFLTLDKKGYLEKKSLHQLYCRHCARFLPDRYVEGSCPRCKQPGARGDQCEKCGSDLDPTELLSPLCKICGQVPILKETFHWFLKLSVFEKPLTDWLESKKALWKENVIHFCEGLLKAGLPDRAITRDMEWGVPVPLPEGKGKVIYVWFDAPIGYISATQEWAARKGEPDLWKKYWRDPDARLIHFIGKDNIVFHSIMWPAVLMGVSGYVLPTHIPANEFLNLEGEKVSTSRGYAIWVHEFLEDFQADSLRYYLASIAPESKDADFSLKEFQAAHNNELADILGNFVNRTVTFAHKYFNGTMPSAAPDAESERIFIAIQKCTADLADAFDHFQVRKSCVLLLDLCREANKYFNDRAPWKSRKDNLPHCGETVRVCLHLIHALSTLCVPLLPFTAEKMAALFPQSLAEGSPVGSVGILFAKIEDEQIDKWIQILRALKK
ncbi:MAG: methionine--tRNA ligase [Elusimicrobia bacterium RIFOXYB2_FULL_49_7]|nr:MAG: methionine--tRNA ligase [Elusimicrobia bacterium RIFOXYB2_FULL_49_7]